MRNLTRDQQILNEIDATIAFCERFTDRLVRFKKELAKNAVPEKRKRGQVLTAEQINQIQNSYFATLTKKRTRRHNLSELDTTGIEKEYTKQMITWSRQFH